MEIFYNSCLIESFSSSRQYLDSNGKVLVTSRYPKSQRLTFIYEGKQLRLDNAIISELSFKEGLLSFKENYYSAGYSYLVQHRIRPIDWEMLSEFLSRKRGGH